MRTKSFPQWAGSPSVTTDTGDCPYYGIAIGPDSDEGAVSVGGLVLQAGRPLPLRGKSYAISHVRPTPSDLASITNLEVLLFESGDELACALARPNRPYAASVTTGTTQPGSASLSVPFVGRPQCLFQITGATVNLDYAIVGVRWNFGANAVQRSLLATEAAVAPDAFGSAAFYMGGQGDEAEIWDVLELYVWTPSGASSVNVEAVVSGELGI